MNQQSKLLLSDDVRKQNRRRIIGQFRKSEIISRTEIGKQTELSPGTVTNVTTSLLSDQVIRTAQNSETIDVSANGRPRVLLELNPDFATIVAGSLTFNGIKLNIVNYAGQVIADLNEPYDLRGKTSEDIARKIFKLAKSVSVKIRPSLYVLGVQGLTGNDGNQIIWSPILEPGGRGFNSELEKITGTKVIIANDSAMIAQSLFDQNSNHDQSFAAILMSYGIGMGLYLNGKPFHGISSSGLEFGHIPYKPKGGATCRCGNIGCVEAYASDYGIWRGARSGAPTFVPDQQITHAELADIFERAEKGDGPEREAVQEAGKAIGYGLATLFVLFDPFPVTFIGRASNGLPLMEAEINKAIAENSALRGAIDVKFSQESDAMSHIENGCAIVALNELDQRVSFQS